MTPFQQALQQVEVGNLQTPSVSYGSKEINYFVYQLAVHHFNLKLMARGMSVRGLKLKDLKTYYGLKGRTATECLAQFEEIKARFESRPENN